MAFSKPVTLLCLALSLICCLAIPDEYDGFLHYHQVDATQDQVLLDGSQLSLSPEVWTAVCEEIHECSGFNSAGYLKAFPRNESVDSYIAKSNCGMNATADITEGSCLHKDRHWQFVHCSSPSGNIDTWYEAKARFNLPPNLIAEACRVDRACIGFVVTQNRMYGWLLEHHKTPEVTDVWIKIPKRRNASVLSVHRPRPAPYRLRIASDE